MRLKQIRFWSVFYLTALLILNSAPVFAQTSFWNFDDDDKIGRYHSPGGRLGFIYSAVPSVEGSAVRSTAGKPIKTPPPGPSYPNDPYYWSTGSWGQSYADLWGIKKIGGSALLWNAYKGDGIVIGVVDTGVIYNQEDISANIWKNPFEIAGNGIDDDNNGFKDDWRGWDFVQNDNNATDLNGHGTHVAGITAADDNNSKGIVGVAPNAKILPVRVLDAAGSGTIQAVANGIRYAARFANIINLSLGAANLDSTSLSILQSAVDFARNLGRIIVAAAGNNYGDVNTFSPANLNGVIAVGATDWNDNHASFSNTGSKLFISAPGVNILSLGSSTTHIGTTVSSNYYLASGTSMASPFVSGAIALLLQKYPGASLDFIKQKLAEGAVDLGVPGFDPIYGVGRLNIAGSLGISSSTSSTVSAADTVSSGQKTSSSVKSSVLDEIADKQSVIAEQNAFKEEIIEAGAKLVQTSAEQEKNFKANAL